MFTLTKTFRFESAHRLAHGYVGKCANIHGHSWNGHIEAQAKEIDDKGLTVDFTDLKKYAKIIEDMYDHGLILSSADQELINFCAKEGMKVTVMAGNPTCENIAQYLFNYLKPIMEADGVVLSAVRIEETCTTSCTYQQYK